MKTETCEHSGISFPSKDGWISVNDELPKNGLRILFICKDLKKVLMGHHIGNGLMQIHPSINGIAAIDNTIFIDMTHWQPLPEVPE